MANDGMSTHDLLVDVGRALLAEAGPARFSLREVARRAGVSAAAVHRHFASKEALLGEVAAVGFQKLCWYLIQATTRKTPRARLDASGDAYLRFGLENPEDYRVIFLTPVRAKGSDTPGEAFRLLVDRVRECIDARVLRRADVDVVATAIWAHVHGLVSLRLSGRLAGVGDDAAFARFYDQSVRKLVSAYEVNTVHNRRGSS
jgi:AcrR family transcriptional regulator